MAIHVYNTSDGTHYSSIPDSLTIAQAQATVPPLLASNDQLAANGFAAIDSLPAIDDTHAWDVATRTVVVVPAPYKPRMIAVGTWILRFTPAEFSVINKSTDATVEQLMFALNSAGPQGIDLNSSTVVNGVNYLVSINLLNAARVAAIMA